LSVGGAFEPLDTLLYVGEDGHRLRVITGDSIIESSEVGLDNRSSSVSPFGRYFDE
jgi:hypothetical protein